MAIVAIDQENWRTSFLWLFLCFVIDAVDGTLARKIRIDEVLPHMDGKRIDFVIDFTAYAVIPAFFFYKAEMVIPEYMPLALVIMLLSSALYYGKKGMVEDEQYFIGFPVLWNFVVFYQFFVFQNNQTLNLISVLVFGILHFVPIKYAYPSRTKNFFWSHLFITVLGLGSVLTILYFGTDHSKVLDVLAVFAISYFAVFALIDTFKGRK